MDETLTFSKFRQVNRDRCLRWHPQGIESWSDSDWIVAIVGELGELASLIKMRNRERDGLVGNKFSPTNYQIAMEAADVFTYLDLFCARNGIALEWAVPAKFNEVSERCNFPERLPLSHQGLDVVPGFVRRMHYELDDLCLRKDKLGAFLGSHASQNVDAAKLMLMADQHELMNRYAAVLRDRLDLELRDMRDAVAKQV